MCSHMKLYFDFPFGHADDNITGSDTIGLLYDCILLHFAITLRNIEKRANYSFKLRMPNYRNVNWLCKVQVKLLKHLPLFFFLLCPLVLCRSEPQISGTHLCLFAGNSMHFWTHTHTHTSSLFLSIHRPSHAYEQKKGTLTMNSGHELRNSKANTNKSTALDSYELYLECQTINANYLYTCGKTRARTKEKKKTRIEFRTWYGREKKARTTTEQKLNEFAVPNGCDWFRMRVTSVHSSVLGTVERNSGISYVEAKWKLYQFRICFSTTTKITWMPCCFAPSFFCHATLPQLHSSFYIDSAHNCCEWNVSVMLSVVTTK